VRLDTTSNCLCLACNEECDRRDALKRNLAILVVTVIALIGMAGAANYMYEKASVKGVGYKNVEMIISTQVGYAGAKLVEKESGSGNVITQGSSWRQRGSSIQHIFYCMGYQVKPLVSVPTGTCLI
jgi:hypothetical protein